MKRLLMLMVFCLGYIALHCQTDSLKIYSSVLREQLHLSSELMPMNEYLAKNTNCTVFHKKVDSSYQVRKKQPDHEMVTNAIKRIMYSRDIYAKDSLVIIYQAYMDKFKEEWRTVFKEHYYVCSPILEQYGLLSSFEEALKSNFLQVKTDKEIFEFYLGEYLIMLGTITKRKGWHEVNTFCKVFSKDYLDLCGGVLVYRGECHISYIDPFINRITPYLFEFMIHCDYSPHGVKSFSDSVSFVFNNFTHLLHNPDDRIKDFIFNNYDQCAFFSAELDFFRYGFYNHDIELSHFLIGKWIENHKSYLESYGKITYFTFFWEQDARNMDIVLFRIFKHGNRHPEEAIFLIKYLPKEDVKKYFRKQQANPYKDEAFLAVLKNDQYFKGWIE